MTWSAIIAGLIVWAISRCIEKAIPPIVRFVAPRLGKKGQAWLQHLAEYTDLVVTSPSMIAVHNAKWLAVQSFLNWATIVAMTGLVIYAIQGGWTMLSAILFIVGLLYYTANYPVQAYETLILSVVRKKEKARIAETTPAQRVRQLRAYHIGNLVAEAMLAGASKVGNTLAEKNEPSGDPPVKKTEEELID
jgi:hypothetical protein